MPDNKQGSGRGFASMDEDKQRDIASEGGKASGGNFGNDRERAAEAGRRGGQQSAEERSGGQQGAGDREGDRGHGGQQQGEQRDKRQQGSHPGGSGNFADDRERASEMGRKGGQS